MHCFRKIFSLVLSLLFVGLLTATSQAQTNLPWHGYIQTRYTENFDNESSFRIRRAKLWLMGKAPIEGNWFYKVQSIFLEKSGGQFTLQDVYAEYRYRAIQLRIGQQIPDFSLQRHQPDYVIPVMERGAAINNLIPSAETGARDIGVQVFLNSNDGHLHTGVGMFNGNGANHLNNEDRQFLFVNRTTFSLPLRHHLQGHLGYSFAYRKTGGIPFKKITGNTENFVGDDFRWGVEARLTHPRWEAQAEFVQTNLGDATAWAYYLLTDYKMTSKNQLVFSLDKYRDLNTATDDSPWYIVDLNHYFEGDKAKIMWDARVQFADTDTNYQTIVQLQLMFN